MRVVEKFVNWFRRFFASNEATRQEFVSEDAKRPDLLRYEARARGYEGNACVTCGNFTMVRNGTCLRCDSCGSTTGCS
jgi:ribonucleoside-diphosphate reductase alpha chain